MENFLAITHRPDDFPGISFRFIDSLRSLNGSLDALSELLDPETDFDIIRREFSGMDLKYLRRKGLFCYDYLDCEEKLLSTVEIPPIEEFYSTLTNSAANASDYAHAKSVWNMLYPKNLLSYTKFYLKLDTLLLASFFEKFRDTSMKNFGLDPAKYVSLPSFSLDAMLLDTGCEIGLITDPEMFFMIKPQIRGGICQMNCRYVEANHVYMENFNPTKRECYLAYIDANALYAHAMRSFLPQKDFKFLSREEIAGLDIMSVHDEASTGYILEVDLDYPSSIHDEHADLPFCAEHMLTPTAKHKKLVT